MRNSDILGEQSVGLRGADAKGGQHAGNRMQGQLQCALCVVAVLLIVVVPASSCSAVAAYALPVDDAAVTVAGVLLLAGITAPTCFLRPSATQRSDSLGNDDAVGATASSRAACAAAAIPLALSRAGAKRRIMHVCTPLHLKKAMSIGAGEKGGVEEGARSVTP